MMADNNQFSLVSKNILVTGASSGIGRAIAVECAKMGATVFITARNIDRLEETLSMMESGDQNVIVADLTKESDRQKLMEELPRLDGIVHNAGVGSRVLCKSITENDLNNVFDTNFKAVVLLQSLLLQKKKINKGASIVFIASKAAEYPSFGNAVYSASKGAIISYSKCLGLELATQNIRVNCVCPAMVWTDLIIKEGITKEELEEAQSKYPLKRYGQPEDVANSVIYLLSDASSWVTGSCLDLTGGGKEL
jgi:NAD(P)-dependent dehydrogenase (short-subunit alcohol dehydrogenase family)